MISMLRVRMRVRLRVRLRVRVRAKKEIGRLSKRYLPVTISVVRWRDNRVTRALVVCVNLTSKTKTNEMAFGLESVA